MQLHLADGGQRPLRRGFAPGAQRGHRLLEHVQVHRQAHFRELAGLALAEEFAGAADFQVVRGQQEAGAQFFHRFDRLEALGGIARERPARGHDQVGVGAMVRAADAAAQLVQLREAQAVGAVDQDGVGGRHVDAALDDGGAHQHVEAPVIEIDHELLEVALAHLPVAEAHLRLRHQRGELRGHLLDALHLVVHQVDLAAAPQFAQAGIAQRRPVPLAHEGLDRQASPSAAC